MAVKTSYNIEGRCWLRIARAADLLGTNSANVKKWMGDGTLDWRQLRTNSKTFLVEEAGVLRLRAERGGETRKIGVRARSTLRTAAQRGRSQLHSPPQSALRSGGDFGIFVPTWDPAPEVPPISAREPPDSKR